MKKFILFIIILLLMAFSVFAWSTSNMGNVVVRGHMNITNASETSNILGSVKVNTSLLYVDSSTRRIGINNGNPLKTLDVTGDVFIRGNLTVVGTEIIANVTTMNINGSILPVVTDVFTLGTTGQIFNQLWVQDIIASDEVNSTRFYQGSDAVLDRGDESGLNVNHSNSTEYWDTLNRPVDIGVMGNFSSDNIVPSITTTYDLGNVSFIWKQVWTSIITVNELNVSGNLDMSEGNITNISWTFTDKLANPLMQADDIEMASGINFLQNNLTNAQLISGKNISGNLTWTDLYGYPGACSANSGLTALGDIITCTDGLYTPTEMAVFLGNWSADKPSYTATNGLVAILGNWSADKASYMPLSGGSFTGNINMTSYTIWFGNNASITTNTTCLILRSPDGTGVINVCDT